MKKLFVGMTLLVLLVSVLSCAAAGDRLEQIKERGYIEVVTEPYFAPNEFIDPSKTGDEQYVGTDMELAKYIADKIGVELKIVPLEFTAVLIGISEGKYDLAISAIAWSPTREMAMKLSDGYEFTDDSGYGFLVRAEDVDKYNSIDSLKDAVVVTQSGSVQEAIYNQYCNNAKQLKLVSSMTDGYLAVSEGKADVCVTHKDSGALYAEANGGLAVPEFKFDVDKRMSSTVVAMSLEDTDSLMEVVNEAIAEVTENGLYKEWEETYKELAKSLGI